MVPIVYGRANYSQVSPPNSVIDFIHQFNSSVKDLAKYLLHLNSHESEYLEYFKWKNEYKIVKPINSDRWCELCRKLKSHNTERKHYDNIHNWWNNAPLEMGEVTTSGQKDDLTPTSKSKSKPIPACLPRPVFTFGIPNNTFSNTE
jgi:hypothetical protein